MSIIDKLLDSAIKNLQKAKKSRQDKKKAYKNQLAKKNNVKNSTKPIKKNTGKSQNSKLDKTIKKVVKKVVKKDFVKKTKKTVKKAVKKVAKKTVKKLPKKAVQIKKSLTSKKAPSKSNSAKNNFQIIKENEELVGIISHYFSKIGVIVFKVTGKPVKVGDFISIRGATTDFSQKIISMQIESKDVKTAKKGQIIGLKAIKMARVGDSVFTKK